MQVKLNNLFRVATNSRKGDLFDPKPFINHWINLSITAGQKGQTAPIILQEGQQIPKILKLIICDDLFNITHPPLAQELVL